MGATTNKKEDKENVKEEKRRYERKQGEKRESK
jgi:hypothetical protein